jgi:hypothetical protein
MWKINKNFKNMKHEKKENWNDFKEYRVREKKNIKI